MLSFYNQKYKDGSEFLVIKSLSYFDDANEDENPVMLNAVSWENIKTFLQNYLKEYLEK